MGREAGRKPQGGGVGTGYVPREKVEGLSGLWWSAAQSSAHTDPSRAPLHRRMRAVAHSMCALLSSPPLIGQQVITDPSNVETSPGSLGLGSRQRGGKQEQREPGTPWVWEDTPLSDK